MQLAPEIAAFVEESEAFYPPDAASRPIAEQRRLYDAYAAAFTPGRPAGTIVEDAALDAGKRAIPLRLYRPADATVPGLVVYLHGGGFVLGSLDSHDGLTARLALESGVPVVAVDYRLAPEHPYPAALDDALAVVRAAMAGRLPFARLSADRPVLAGDSAGGTLAAAAALALRDAGEAVPAALALVYPLFGREPAEPAASAEAEAPMLTRADVRAYRDAFLAGAEAPGAFPLEAADFAGLPPTLLLPVEHDPLRDDCATFAERLAAAGVPVTLDLGRGLVHGSLRAIERSDEAARQWRLLTGFITSASSEAAATI